MFCIEFMQISCPDVTDVDPSGAETRAPIQYKDVILPV